MKLWLSSAIVALVAPWNLSPSERAALDGGAVVVRMASPADEAEVVTWSAVRVSAGPEAFRDCAADPKCLFGYDGLLGVGRLALQPGPQDFDALFLDASDHEHLERCRVGRCRVRASADTITRFQSVNWSQPDAPRRADALFRGILAGVAQRYSAFGDPALETYADRERRTPVAEIASLLLARPLPLLDLAPDVRACLQTAPALSGSNGAQYLAWRKDRFWRQNLVSLDHVAVQQADGGVVVAAVKQLYASHYFDSAIEVFAWLPAVDGDRGLLLHMSRAQADVRDTGLAWYERALLNRLARGRLQRHLTALRDRLSSRPRPAPSSVPLRASR